MGIIEEIEEYEKRVTKFLNLRIFRQVNQLERKSIGFVIFLKILNFT
jgi:hypothetical protein